MATTPNRGYQLPAPGSKLKDDVLRLIAALGAIDTDVAGLLTALAGKSDLGHGHTMAEITGLVAALGNKIDVGYHDALANLTDVDVAGVANGMALLRQASKWIPVALQINNIAGLETALNGKATPADITAAINALVAAAPGALDTLNELATALGNDPNFASTITTALAGKQPLDSDLTAIAALTTTTFGRALLTAADAVDLRTSIGANLLGGFRNLLINPLGTINQRGYVSGAATAGANRYTLDRWRVVTSGQNLSWSESEGVRTMTAPAGGVEQVVESSAILPGDHVLTWEGTATATVNGLARASGEVFSLAGGANATVRFTGGTVKKPQLERASSPTAFSSRHPQQELALCQRYYEVGRSGWYGYVTNGYTFAAVPMFKVTKRTTPTISLSLYVSAYFPGSAGNAGDVTTTSFVHSKQANGNDPRGAFVDDWVADAEI